MGTHERGRARKPTSCSEARRPHSHAGRGEGPRGPEEDQQDPESTFRFRHHGSDPLPRHHITAACLRGLPASGSRLVRVLRPSPVARCSGGPIRPPAPQHVAATPGCRTCRSIAAPSSGDNEDRPWRRCKGRLGATWELGSDGADHVHTSAFQGRSRRVRSDGWYLRLVARSYPGHLGRATP